MRTVLPRADRRSTVFLSRSGRRKTRISRSRRLILLHPRCQGRRYANRNLLAPHQLRVSIPRRPFVSSVSAWFLGGVTMSITLLSDGFPSTVLYEWAREKVLCHLLPVVARRAIPPASTRLFHASGTSTRSTPRGELQQLYPPSSHLKSTLKGFFRERHSPVDLMDKRSPSVVMGNGDVVRGVLLNQTIYRLFASARLSDKPTSTCGFF
uniref:Uncharacterized protein n=1 Tax=Candidatus Kentrum sp. TC TaxID=2126339 RepID=A0A451A8Z3_9GAMM|nr:MAG: hypothetical protein BECKTC1821F_GA0114240_10758 [Candidatus Kentron sp. TC]